MPIKRIVILGTVCAIVLFCFGYFFFTISTHKSEKQVQAYLAESKKLYNAIPLWHKKIQTDQGIKIGVITDTHVHPNRIDRGNTADDAPRYLNEKHMKPLDKFNLQMQEFQPEIIVHVGDVIEGTNDEDIVGMQGIKLVEKELKKSGVPIYWAVGNHDLRSVTKEQFQEVLALDSLNQMVDKGDYRFIILDANYNRENLSRSPEGNSYIRGKLHPETLVWLEEQLKTDKRVYIFMHHAAFLNETSGDAEKKKQSIEGAEELRSMLDEYRVDGFFNGHMEARRYEKEKSTHYYSLTGTKKSKTYPQSFYELIIIDGMPAVTMFYVPDDSENVKSVDFESGEK